MVSEFLVEVRNGVIFENLFFCLAERLLRGALRQSRKALVKNVTEEDCTPDDQLNSRAWDAPTSTHKAASVVGEIVTTVADEYEVEINRSLSSESEKWNGDELEIGASVDKENEKKNEFPESFSKSKKRMSLDSIKPRRSVYNGSGVNTCGSQARLRSSSIPRDPSRLPLSPASLTGSPLSPVVRRIPIEP